MGKALCPPGKFIVAGSEELHYVEEGSSSAAPLLLLHGLISSNDAWRKVRPQLAEHYRVLTPDLVGHGFSSKHDAFPMTLAAHAEVVKAFLDAMGVDRCALIGQSMGGGIALLLAAEHPQLVEKLVVVDPVCFPFKLPLEGRLALLPGIGYLIFRYLYNKAMMRKYFRHVIYFDRGKLEVAEIDLLYAYLNTAVARRAIYRGMQAMANLPDLAATFGRIEAPTLILWGAQDKLIPPSLGPRLQQTLENAKLEVVQDCGHQMMTECSEVFLQQVRKFLAAGGVNHERDARP